jgi:hypothetical protein
MVSIRKKIVGYEGGYPRGMPKYFKTPISGYRVYTEKSGSCGPTHSHQRDLLKSLGECDLDGEDEILFWLKWKSCP